MSKCTQERTERHRCAARFHLIQRKLINAVTRRVTTENQVVRLPFTQRQFRRERSGLYITQYTVIRGLQQACRTQ